MDFVHKYSIPRTYTQTENTVSRMLVYSGISDLQLVQLYRHHSVDAHAGTQAQLLLLKKTIYYQPRTKSIY